MAVKKLCRIELTTSAATLYTSENAQTQITAATLSNKTASARTASVYVVDVGGSSADDNALIVKDVSIPGNSVVGVPELVGQSLDKDEFIQALADGGSALTLFISGNVVN